jgi:nucleoporin NDC1
MVLLPSGNRALKLSVQTFLISHFLVFFLPWQFRKGGSVGILTEISILIVTAGIGFCLEINYQFVQVCSSLCSESSVFGA